MLCPKTPPYQRQASRGESGKRLLQIGRQAAISLGRWREAQDLNAAALHRCAPAARQSP